MTKEIRMFHARHHRPRVVLLDSSLGALPMGLYFDGPRHYDRPRFARRLFRFAMFAGAVYLTFRFWFVPVGIAAFFLGRYAVRRAVRSLRRDRVERPEIIVPPPKVDPIDAKVQKEIEDLEQRFR
jgi:hypothetical protein